MEYKKTSAIGDAGEHYFAYWIAQHFNYPCRLLDIDLGIDAQIEILDSNNYTTGDFIAVQIKTTTNEKKDGEPISYNNLLYWRDISEKTPVILIFIDITNHKIYWKYMSLELINKYLNSIKNKNSTIKVKFDEETDKLDKRDKSKFSILPYKNSFEIIKDEYAKLTPIISFFKKVLTNNKNELDYDFFANKLGSRLHNNSPLPIISVPLVLDYISEAYYHLDNIKLEMNKLGRFPKAFSKFSILAEKKVKWLESILYDLMGEYLRRHSYMNFDYYKTDTHHVRILNLFNKVRNNFLEDFDCKNNKLPHHLSEEYNN